MKTLADSSSDSGDPGAGNGNPFAVLQHAAEDAHHPITNATPNPDFDQTQDDEDRDGGGENEYAAGVAKRLEKSYERQQPGRRHVSGVKRQFNMV